MADSLLNQFVSRGTNAERLAYTPTPPTPGTGPDPGYFFYETDTGNTYTWDGAAWDQVNAAASFASTTEVLTGTDTTKAVNPNALAALWEQGSDVASAGTISLGEGGYFNITGTTTITDVDFGTDKAGRAAWAKFAGILTLTNGANLILPTGANITTAAGDTACFVSEGTDVIRCVAYNRADGTALAGSGGSTAWALAGTGQTATGVYDFAVDGAKANVDFIGLAGSTDILVFANGVTKSVSGTLALTVSTDNGSTFYTTSGDYLVVDAAGSRTATVSVVLHGTNATTARNGMARINGANVAVPKVIEQINNNGSHRLFVASTAAINAIRLNGSAGGDLNGGVIYCLAR